MRFYLSMLLFLGAADLLPAKEDAIAPDRIARSAAARSAILDAVEQYSHDRFTEALAELDNALTAEPGNPIALFLKAEVYWQLWLINREHRPYNANFHQWMGQAIESAQGRLKQNRADTDAMLVVASAYARLGMFEGVNGKMFAAARRSIKAIDMLDQVVELKPDLYDAYFGLGMYDYLIAGHSTGARLAFKFLGGIFGNKERGLERLKLAAERGTWSKGSARFFLGLIYGKYEKGQEDVALEWLEPLVEEYPDNQSYRGLQTSLLVQAGRAAEAVPLYRAAAARARQRNLDGPESRAMDHYKLGNALRLAAQPREARVELEAALAVPVSPDKSWVPAYTHLALGRLADAEGERATAEQEYRKVLGLKDQQDSKKLAKLYLQRPYRSYEERGTVEPWY